MRNKVIPERTCLGCREAKKKDSLVRISYCENKVTLDPIGNQNGRGAYLCRKPECLELAIKKKAFARSFRTQVSQDDLEKLVLDFNRYIESLRERY